jgi:hypothetical protein
MYSAASGHSITAQAGSYAVTGSQPALFITNIKARISYRFHSLLNRDVFGGGRGTSE